MFDRAVKHLQDVNQPIPKYIAIAVVISFVPSILLSMLFGALMPEAQKPPLDVGWKGFLGAWLVAPWAESLLMVPILMVLRNFAKDPMPLAFSSALCWALIHSWKAPIWGLVIFWPFFVFSMSMISWHRAKGLGTAVAITAVIHMGQNTVPSIILLLNPS